MGVTNGFSVVLSQAYGEKDFASFKRAAASSITLSILSALYLTGIGLWCLRPVLRIMQTDQTLVKDCLSYGYVIFGGLTVTVFYNLVSAMLRAVGDSRTPLLAIVVSSCVNIGLDVLFLFVLDTGVAGPAWATILSQLMSVVICGGRLLGIREFRLSGSDFAFDFDYRMEKELLRNGVPMALMNSITSVGCIFVQSCINGYGVAYTSAYSVCNKYLNFFMLPGITTGFAVAAFTGQNFGAGEFKRIHGATRAASVIALVSSLFLVLLNLLFVFRNCVQGMGKPVVPMCSGIAEMVIRMGVIFFGLPVFGFRAAVYAEGAAWIGALFLNWVSYWYFIGRMEKQLPG